MHLSHVVLTGLAVLTAVAPGAGADGRAACRLVVDAEYDDQATPATGQVPREASSPRVDVTSADVASNARRVTGVIRVRGLGAADPASTTGASYRLSLGARGQTFVLMGERSAESQRFLLVLERGSGMGEVLGRVDGDFDEDRSEVRITAPLSMLRPHIDLSPGTAITPISVDTFHSQGVAHRPLPAGPPVSYMNGIGADSAHGGRAAYRAGSASCVTP